MNVPDRLQIMFLATGAFAVPSMRAICESGRHDTCLITNPLRYDKAGNPIVTPARRFAEEYDVHIVEKDDVHSDEFFNFIYLTRPDIVFVCDFGHILKQRVLDSAGTAALNLHGSLLPKYRGAAPVHWAILNGETFTGVTIIRMTSKVDAGEIIAQSPPIPIGAYETLPELEQRLAEYGAELVLDVIDRMARKEKVKIIGQKHEKTSKAPKLKKSHGPVDWTASATEIFNHYRALVEWPRSSTCWQRDEGEPLRLILGGVLPLDDSFHEVISEDYNDPVYVEPVLADAKMDNLAVLKTRLGDLHGVKQVAPKKQFFSREFRPRDRWKPGTVIRAEDDELIVAAGEGTVRILRIQPAGKRMMDVRDFLRGYPVKPGDRFV